MSILCLVDDKNVPLYRIMWVSAIPHFCGAEDCQSEGKYEVRLENGESVWANTSERNDTIEALERWRGGLDLSDDQWDTEEE